MKGGNFASPLNGVKVVVNDFYNTAYGITGNNGETGVIGKFANPVNYYIYWEDPKWNILEAFRDDTYVPLVTYGPSQHISNWVHSFSSFPSENEKDLCASAVHKALNEYFYSSYSQLNGLTKYQPTKKLKVKVNFWFYMYAAGFFARDVIYVYPVSNSFFQYYPKYFITETVFHELGHG